MVPEDAKKTIRTPVALVYPVNSTADPQHGEQPNLVQVTLNVTVITTVPGDAVGEKTIIGGNIPDDAKSEGKGVLEIEEEVFSAIGSLQADNGITISLRTASMRQPTYDPNFGYVAFRDLVFQCWCATTRQYYPVNYLTATGGSGQVALEWGLPPDRFDRYRVVLRRASGGTAPATISDGTGVTLSGNLATSVTDTGLAAGTYSYSIFATYDEKDGRPGGTPDTDQRVSSAVSRQSIIVS
jgi:hypothetical protein